MVYILIAILIFGVLIAVHEFGHFLAAKACGVRVNEFSIGMGPQLFHKTKGDTEYSLRLLPIGGYCAMEGEDEDSDDDRALGRQVWWKKFIIFVAGAFMNFLTGLIIVICLYAGAQAFYTTEIVELNPDFPQQGEDGLMPGDTIYAINGERIYLKSDVSLIMGLGDTGTIDMTVLRDGKKFDRTLTKQVYTDENGKEYEAYGFTYGGIVEATPLLRLQYSWYQTMDYVRIVRLSLQMLLSGAAGVNDLSGPVGIVSTITEVGKETEAEAGFGAALESILYFAAMIAVNLAVMNLLPLPALDGGHVLFLLVNGIAVALLAVNNPIAVIFTGCFMSILDIAGLQITNLTVYNEYITDVIIAVIVYMAAFSLIIKMWIAERQKKRAKKAEQAAPAAPAAETPAEKREEVQK